MIIVHRGKRYVFLGLISHVANSLRRMLGINVPTSKNTRVYSKFVTIDRAKLINDDDEIMQELEEIDGEKVHARIETICREVELRFGLPYAPADKYVFVEHFLAKYETIGHIKHVFARECGVAGVVMCHYVSDEQIAQENISPRNLILGHFVNYEAVKLPHYKFMNMNQAVRRFGLNYDTIEPRAPQPKNFIHAAPIDHVIYALDVRRAQIAPKMIYSKLALFDKVRPEVRDDKFGDSDESDIYQHIFAKSRAQIDANSAESAEFGIAQEFAFMFSFQSIFDIISDARSITVGRMREFAEANFFDDVDLKMTHMHYMIAIKTIDARRRFAEFDCDETFIAAQQVAESAKPFKIVRNYLDFVKFRELEMFANDVANLDKKKKPRLAILAKEDDQFFIIVLHNNRIEANIRRDQHAIFRKVLEKLCRKLGVPLAHANFNQCVYDFVLKLKVAPFNWEQFAERLRRIAHINSKTFFRHFGADFNFDSDQLRRLMVSMTQQAKGRFAAQFMSAADVMSIETSSFSKSETAADFGNELKIVAIQDYLQIQLFGIAHFADTINLAKLLWAITKSEHLFRPVTNVGPGPAIRANKFSFSRFSTPQTAIKQLIDVIPDFDSKCQIENATPSKRRAPVIITMGEYDEYVNFIHKIVLFAKFRSADAGWARFLEISKYLDRQKNFVGDRLLKLIALVELSPTMKLAAKIALLYKIAFRNKHLYKNGGDQYYAICPINWCINCRRIFAISERAAHRDHAPHERFDDIGAILDPRGRPANIDTVPLTNTIALKLSENFMYITLIAKNFPSFDIAHYKLAACPCCFSNREDRTETMPKTIILKKFLEMVNKSGKALAIEKYKNPWYNCISTLIEKYNSCYRYVVRNTERFSDMKPSIEQIEEYVFGPVDECEYRQLRFVTHVTRDQLNVELANRDAPVEHTLQLFSIRLSLSLYFVKISEPRATDEKSSNLMQSISIFAHPGMMDSYYAANETRNIVFIKHSRFNHVQYYVMHKEKNAMIRRDTNVQFFEFIDRALVSNMIYSNETSIYADRNHIRGAFSANGFVPLYMDISGIPQCADKTICQAAEIGKTCLPVDIELIENYERSKIIALLLFNDKIRGILTSRGVVLTQPGEYNATNYAGIGVYRVNTDMTFEEFIFTFSEIQAPPRKVLVSRDNELAQIEKTYGRPLVPARLGERRSATYDTYDDFMSASR